MGLYLYGAEAELQVDDGSGDVGVARSLEVVVLHQLAQQVYALVGYSTASPAYSVDNLDRSLQLN